MERTEIVSQILAILEDVAEISPDDVNENSVLMDDLDLSSMEILTVVADLEETFGLRIPEKELRNFVTISDLADYLADGRSRKTLSVEKARHEAAKRAKGEGQRHDAEMRRLLTSEGYTLYTYRTQFMRFLWQPVPLPELSPRTIRSLVSTTQYQRRHGLPSNGVARKRLMEQGSVQIKLGGKTLWVEAPAPEGIWVIPAGTLP